MQHFAGLGHPTPVDVNVADMVLDLVIKSPVCSCHSHTLGNSIAASAVKIRFYAHDCHGHVL